MKNLLIPPPISTHHYIHHTTLAPHCTQYRTLHTTLIHIPPPYCSLLPLITTIYLVTLYPTKSIVHPICSPNLNGISSHESCFKYQLCIQEMTSIAADVILLPETNLLWKDWKVHNETTAHQQNLLTHSRQNTDSFKTKHFLQ